MRYLVRLRTGRPSATNFFLKCILFRVVSSKKLLRRRSEASGDTKNRKNENFVPKLTFFTICEAAGGNFVSVRVRYCYLALNVSDGTVSGII